MKLSEKIAYLRKEKGWSQEQLASKLAVSRQAVYKWEADISQPEMDKLKKLSQIFNTSLDVLINDDINLPTITPVIVETEEFNKTNENDKDSSENEDLKKENVVNNKVAVQINYNKDENTVQKKNKKFIAVVGLLLTVIIISFGLAGYIVLGVLLDKESYLIKFDTLCEQTIENQVVKDGKTISLVSSPTKKGYTFEGWYYGDTKWDFEKNTVSSSMTLSAKWTPNRNTITYFKNDGTSESVTSYANTDESLPLMANSFKRDGFTFMGWATSPKGEVEFDNCESYKMGVEGITLYAVWSFEHYSLVLNANGGFISESYKTTFTANDSVILPTPVCKYYAFDGWYDQNGNRVSLIQKGTNCDVVLNAKYTPISYNIYYQLDGGTNNDSNPNCYDASTIVKFQDPTRDDYAFCGWYLDPDYLMPIEKTTLGIGGDITLYARWETTLFSFMGFGSSYTLIGYSGTDSVVSIPATYDGVPVTAIGDYAFYELDTITKIIIPSTISYVSPSAFDGCMSLADITVDKGNMNFTSENGILYNKNKTVIHKYPAGRESSIYIAPNTLDVINPYAFSYAIYLEEVYLPNDRSLEFGVGKICEGAFEGCISLNTIELGYIANYFEQYCFSNCWSLETIQFKADTIWGIENNAFENCLLLSTVRFDCNTVKNIGDYAFLGCLSLSDFDLTTVKGLGSNVFEETGLTSIYIPSSVSTIGDNLFVDCKNLRVYCQPVSKPSDWSNSWSGGALEVKWGQREPNLENQLLYEEYSTYITITGCIGEGSVIIPSKINDKYVNYIGPNAFSGQTKITEIWIPGSVAGIDLTAFDNCPSLEKIVFNDQSNRYYGSIDGVLYADFNKQLIKYPEGKRNEVFTVPYHVDIIGAYAFKDNLHLKKVILPSDFVSDNYIGKLEQGAFQDCTNLTEVEGLYASYLERDVFKNCSALKEITFYANDVWGIGNYSFLNCSSLESVTFKGNIHEIGYQVFGYCTELSSVSFSGTLGALSIHAFESCISLTGITLPVGITTMASEAFKGCINLTSINIPTSVTKIEDYAFLGTSIKEILIPSTVIEIEEYPFYGLSDLILYCEPFEKPSGWNDKWNYANSTDTLTVKWGQNGPNDIEFTFSKNADGTLTLTECKGSGSAIIPERHNGTAITEIGEKAFRTQSDITLIRIPKTVTKIAKNAFDLCYHLQSIEVDSENTEFSSESGVLYNKSKSALIHYPMSKTGESLSLPSTVTLIDDHAFYANMHLKSITIKGDISRVGFEAFSSCMALNRITFNGELKELSEKAFYWNPQLTSINLPQGLTKIPAYAFSHCLALKNIIIPSSVTTIEGYAFESTVLEGIFIPATVTTIEENAFLDVLDLTIYCEAAEKPSGWSDKWNYASEEAILEAFWGQSGLPS